MHLGVILIKRKKTRRAGIAQLVEQWTENPRVTSSNLVPGIHYIRQDKKFESAAQQCFQIFYGFGFERFALYHKKVDWRDILERHFD